jgi:hypothetical protein
LLIVLHILIRKRRRINNPHRTVIVKDRFWRTPEMAGRRPVSGVGEQAVPPTPTPVRGKMTPSRLRARASTPFSPLPTVVLDVDGAFAAARKIVESPRRKTVRSQTQRTIFTSPVCLTRLPCMSPSTKAPEGLGATVVATRRLIL